MSNVCRSTVSLLCLGVLAACGSNDGTPATGAVSADVAAPPTVDIGELLKTANADKGKVLFLQCRACHSLEEGGANKVGPNLWGMFGKEAGFTPGFAYSEAMEASDVVWTPATIDAWLERPASFLPGNRMVFTGVRKAEDRADLIAYLQRETQGETQEGE